MRRLLKLKKNWKLSKEVTADLWAKKEKKSYEYVEKFCEMGSNLATDLTFHLIKIFNSEEKLRK
jgi:hypothetical protein